MNSHRELVFQNYLEIEKNYPFVEESVNFIGEVLNLYNFQNDTLFLTFNGGKDATIVLYLTVIALMKSQNPNAIINCIYFQETDSFPEVEEFVRQQIIDLDLNMTYYQSNIKQQLHILKQETKAQAVIMGTRSTDPYAQNLERISVTESSKGYPSLLRINPILYWNYNQVWKFLIDFQIPFCSLYKQGYTYLGNKNTTVINSQLITSDGSMKPAWEAQGDGEYLSRKNQDISHQEQQGVLYIICGEISQQAKQTVHHLNIQYFDQNAELSKYFRKIQSINYKEIIIKLNFTDNDLLAFISKEQQQKTDL